MDLLQRALKIKDPLQWRLDWRHLQEPTVSTHCLEEWYMPWPKKKIRKIVRHKDLLTKIMTSRAVAATWHCANRKGSHGLIVNQVLREVGKHLGPLFGLGLGVSLTALRMHHEKWNNILITSSPPPWCLLWKAFLKHIFFENFCNRIHKRCISLHISKSSKVSKPIFFSFCSRQLRCYLLQLWEGR